MSDKTDIDDIGDSGDDLLAAEFVLRTLPPELEEQLAWRRSTEPDFARRIDAWEQRLAGLNGNFPDIEPPKSVKAALDRQLFATTATARPALSSRIGFWRSLALGATALAAVAVAWPIMTQQSSQGGALSVATLNGETADNSFVIVYNEAENLLNVRRQSETVTAAGQDLQLWAIVGDAAPVPVGIIGRDGNGNHPVTAEEKVLFAKNPTFAVSVEPLGGSPTGLPTGPVIAAGPLKKI